MNNKTKILFIMESLNEGGAEKVLIDILKNFDYNVYNVTLLLKSNQGVYLSQVPQQVKLLILCKNQFFLRLYKLLMLLYLKIGINFLVSSYIKQRVKDCHDVTVSFMEGFPLLAHNALIKKTSLNISWVHTDFNRNHWTKSKFNKRDENKVYNKMDKIIFVSNSAKEELNKVFNITKPEQRVLYNIIDICNIQSFSSKIIPEKSKFTLCAVGRLSPVKAFDRLLNVAFKLKQANYDVDIWILGSGYLLDQLQKQAKQLGVDSMVHFFGSVNPPYAYMRQADIFVCTSITEGFPLVVCEALCLGLPIVSTKTTGPIELLDENKYGILTEHSEESICDAIVYLIQDEQVRKKYANASLERSKMFNVDNTMNEIYSLFN